MSRFLMSVAALLTLTLAACAPQPDEQEQATAQSEQRAVEAAQPAPPEPATAAAACDDSQAQWAIGKKVTEAEIDQHLAQQGNQYQCNQGKSNTLQTSCAKSDQRIAFTRTDHLSAIT